jgi:excinuclease ABC subunit B
MNKFKLESNYKPAGDQPKAIENLLKGLKEKNSQQILLGVTGSGKTYTIANVIEKLDLPVLVMSPNKTLAAQLYVEFKNFFPHNPVEYFISYYDYYQPEAYIPHSDTYIEKDSSVNENIEKLRLKATTSLLESRNTIIVASVSCIYGLGSPEDYEGMMLNLYKGQKITRNSLITQLVNVQYERNEMEFTQKKFRVKGNIIDIFPAYLDIGVRIELDDDSINRIMSFDPLTGNIKEEKEKATIYPAKHFVINKDKRDKGIESIKKELKERLDALKKQNKLVEAQRLEQRTEYDMEMLAEMGYCNGIENYSRHLSGKHEGERPFCLLDYFPKPFLLIMDESHIGIPQVRGMYNGDRARKQTLVDYGFRLPSALDNRPLKFDEFENLIHSVIYVSATPGDYEITKSRGKIVEQIIRPTGLVDPKVDIKPTKNMVDDTIIEISKVVERKERVLITTLTKRFAEDLAQYMEEKKIRARYLHSEIDALERIKIIAEFREGKFDCLIGINLLREGLDLPEVSLVVIMDADKEGFLRSERSLIQTCGRAARNVNGRIIMYADTITGSMKNALSEMERRRKIQIAYNTKYSITPKTIKKNIDYDLVVKEEIQKETLTIGEMALDYKLDKKSFIKKLEKEMIESAENWDFEKAILLRDKIKELKKK